MLQLLGVVQLLNLFDDLDLVKLESQLLGWIRVYGDLVDRINSWLFAPLAFWVFGVAVSETHSLLIAALVLISLAWAVKPEGAPDETVLWWAPMLLIFGFPQIAVAYLAPAFVTIPFVLLTTLLSIPFFFGGGMSGGSQTAAISRHDFVKSVGRSLVIAGGLAVMERIAQQAG